MATPKHAVEVHQLSKKFRLSARKQKTLRSALDQAWTQLKARSAEALYGHCFWAIRDVSFTVAPGEIVAIAGANGSGKSTLLRVLSRITEPTSGHATIRGRFASLLEMGTGFHPELTGRENIYLNGTMLGISRKEITAKLDEIVSFAGIEGFLDTAVKRYSSGMYLRLAFSAAIGFAPEVLFLDEVLAVGDLSFQRQCIDKAELFARQGRTLLFVSHNQSLVERFCHRCIVLEKGQVVFNGKPAEAFARFQLQASAPSLQ